MSVPVAPLMNSTLLPALLLCNSLANPLGVHDPAPRLTWQLAAEDRRGIVQTAYQIKVSTRPGGPADLWDSGRVSSEQSVQVRYAGQPLPSRTRAYWQVTYWDDQGTAVTSQPGASFWETGLLRRDDWSAQWIGAPWHGDQRRGAHAPYLRKRFELPATPVSARLYITALGLYQAYLNGHQVGSDVFTPGWTDYIKRVQYQVYDVTELLVSGPNTLAGVLGDGWYCGHVSAEGRERYGHQPRLLAQLEITGRDGQRVTIVSDGTWQVARGAIVENDLLMGESYDARQELAGWPGAAPDDRTAAVTTSRIPDTKSTNGEATPPDLWESAMVFPDPKIELSPTLARPVRAHETLTAKSIVKTSTDERREGFIFDFGQNLVGNVTLRVKAPAGTTLRLRFAEMLDASGKLYTENLRTARATDYYTCKGDPAGEVWTPLFTFHGFRYAEISGLPDKATPDTATLVARVLHTDLPESGDFTCSDPLINQLQHNIQWGERGNYLEVPTDCPQRDERLGWTGDAQAFIRTGIWNRDVAAFFTKWQRDLADAQGSTGATPPVIPSTDRSGSDGGPAWADAMVICPWTVYQCYADRALLEQHFDSIRRYVDFIVTRTLNGIRLHPDLPHWQGFGDWLALDGSGKVDGGTPKDLIGTAFYAHDLRLLAAMASVLGQDELARRYSAQAEQIKAAFVRRFVTQDGLVAGNTQTSYVLALHFDLVPPELRPKLTAALVRDIRSRGTKLSTGFVGTPYLLHVLTAEGQLDLAYELLMQKEWPSWLYAVTQGATTIWERWDGWTKEKGFQDPGMNSFNHYAYGAVGDWLYRVVAGVELDPAKPGYKHFFLQPRPGTRLTSARAHHRSPYGEIVSDWKKSPETFEWEVVVPPNTSATARFPVPANATVVDGNTPVDSTMGVTQVRREGGVLTCELASGRYRFRATWPKDEATPVPADAQKTL